MSLPYIAAQLGAALMIFQIGLMLNTGLHRAKSKQFIGLGPDLNMERKVRRHGNLAENAALFVVMMAIAELLDLSPVILGWIAVLFFMARLSHALAFNSLIGSHGPEAGSAIGTADAKVPPKLFILLRLIGAFGTALTGLSLALYIGVAVLLG